MIVALLFALSSSESFFTSDQPAIVEVEPMGSSSIKNGYGRNCIRIPIPPPPKLRRLPNRYFIADWAKDSL